MKIYYAFIFIAFIASNKIDAQPTLTAVTSIPPIGLSYPIFQNNQYLPGSSGAAQNWDFSTSSFSLAGNQLYEACTAINLCSLHPGTTVVNNQNYGGGTYVYLIGATGALSMKGIGSFAEIQYSDPQDFFRFPLTYSNTYVDTFKAVFTYAAATSYRSGNDSVSADGWGTLKTPAGTFANVLCVKHIETYRDSSITSGTPAITSYKTTRYTWNDVLHPDPLYSTSTTLTTPQTGSSSTANRSSYSGTQKLTIAPIAIATGGWSVTPNPARQEMHLFIRLNSGGSLSFRLIDMTGNTVRTVPANEYRAGANELICPIAGLPSGTYMVLLRSRDGVEVRKVEIQ